VTGQHFLIVHPEPEDGMDITHPPSCPTELIHGGRTRVHTCNVGFMVEEFGVDLYFRREEVAPPGREGSEYAPVGCHPVWFWSDEHYSYFYGVSEFDCGLTLIPQDGGDAS
jgi:hypothetical protein